MNIDVYIFSDITTALQNAQDGEVFNFFIMRNITFTSAVIINRSITINIINASGEENITLIIANGGGFRHFIASNINNVILTIGEGIILNGNGTSGGIQIIGSGCLVTLNSCVIINCVNSSNGGGILIGGGVNRSNLIINSAFIRNCRAGAGGGAFCNGCSLEMNRGEITGNRAVNEGGGVTLIASASGLGSILTINGGKINGNTVEAPFSNGGGISAFDTITTITSNSEIRNNTADLHGGGINVLNQTGNTALNALIISDSIISGNVTGGFGGGIAVQNSISEFTITNCIISENTSNTELPRSRQGGGIYYTGPNTLTINNSVIFKNVAGSSGGGIFANHLAVLIINGTSEIRENEAALTAGGIYGYQGATITIQDNVKIINNQAFSGLDPNSTIRGGGGIALLAFDFVSILTVRGNALISGNTSVSYGGGIWTYPNFGPEIIVNIEGATIEGNTANFGGGISMGAIPGFKPALTVSNAVIGNNIAGTDGGAIIAMESTVSISRCNIINNTAGRNGGAIFTDQLANVTVDSQAAPNFTILEEI